MIWENVVTVPAMTLQGAGPLVTAVTAYRVRRVPESATTTDGFGSWNIENGSHPGLSVHMTGDVNGWTSSAISTAPQPNVNHIRLTSVAYKRDLSVASGGTVSIGGFLYMGNQGSFGVDPVYPAEIRGVIAVAVLHDLDGMLPSPNVSLPFPTGDPRSPYFYPDAPSGVQTSGPVPIPEWNHYPAASGEPVIVWYAADNTEGGGTPPISSVEDPDDGWGDILSYSAYDFSVLIGLAMTGATLPHEVAPGSSLVYQGTNSLTNFIVAPTFVPFAQVIG